MTTEEFKDLERRYLKEKKIQDALVSVTMMRCPICGEPLYSRIITLGGSQNELKAVIRCNHCKMLHAESRVGSYNEKCNIEATLIEDVTKKVIPFVKSFV